MNFFFLMKEHIVWIICENYTPNGVVVVVYVISNELTPKQMVINELTCILLISNIIQI